MNYQLIVVIALLVYLAGLLSGGGAVLIIEWRNYRTMFVNDPVIKLAIRRGNEANYGPVAARGPRGGRPAMSAGGVAIIVNSLIEVPAILVVGWLIHRETGRLTNGRLH